MKPIIYTQPLNPSQIQHLYKHANATLNTDYNLHISTKYTGLRLEVFNTRNKLVEFKDITYQTNITGIANMINRVFTQYKDDKKTSKYTIKLTVSQTN